MSVEKFDHASARLNPFSLVILVTCRQRSVMAGCRVLKMTPRKTEERRFLTGMPRTVGISARNAILPHQHTEPVAMIIPAFTFNFDMFAQRIEASRAHSLYVIYQRFIGWRRHKTVRPIPLVKYSTHKERSPVQMDSGDSLGIRCHFDRAKRTVALYNVYRRISRPQHRRYCIQIRILRRPKARRTHM